MTSPSKYMNIPILPDYSKAPDETFRETFSRRDLLQQPNSKVKAEALRELVVEFQGNLSTTEAQRFHRVIADFETGASAYEKSLLPTTLQFLMGP